MKRGESKRCAALVCCLALLLCLCSCAGRPDAAPSGTEAPPESAAPQPESPSPSPAEAAPSPAPAETKALYGSPWADSLVAGNVPEQAPDARDDLYLHYNYDTLLDCAGMYYIRMNGDELVMANAVFPLIWDETRGAPDGAAYTDRELEQLRIFYRQASDVETILRGGFSELEPYLERIRAAGTLEELNAVLTGEDFPFSPYLLFTVSAYDMSEGNNVFLCPDFLFVDDLSGGEHFQDSDDPVVHQADMDAVNEYANKAILELLALGLSEEEAEDTLYALFDLEQAYGKDAGYNDRYLSQPFGTLAAANVDLSLEELAARCPNFPVRETVEKFGKDVSRSFTVFGEEWLPAFSAVWTEENLELLKTMTMVKLLDECLPFVDISAAAGDPLSVEDVDPIANAWSVMNRTDTFTQLIGKIYVSDHFQDGTLARLTRLSEELVDACRGLLEETPWLGEISRARMLEKLDRMRLNVLCPDGGWLDFSDLELLPAEEGGTLLGSYLRLKAWRNAKDNALLSGGALARISWDLYFPTTFGGCGYDLDTNSINILPGLPASLGCGPDTSQEALLATVGWVIGHEISHAFDFSGAQFDAFGAPNAVFDGADLERYLAVVGKLSACYDGIEAMPETNVVGERVKTEAAADLIGLQLALRLAAETPDFDYEAFWQAFAEYLFMVLPDESYLPFFLADEHPLSYLRCNVNAQMYPEFYESFGVKPGDGMYLPETERIRFWGK